MDEAVEFLRERVTRAPSVALILGSGLGSVADGISDPVRIPFAEVPGFAPATVAGHAGALVAGVLNGVEVVAMQGRFHLYEGHSPSSLALPIRVLAALGAEALVVTNAAGGVRPGLDPGDLMLIADHLNLTGRNPLAGPVTVGEDRFPDMSAPYDPELREIARRVALGMGISLQEGVYAGVLGPSYETPAEIRMLRGFGAAAVGMSTVPEVLVARALGLRVLGISCITNVAAGAGSESLTHDEVIRAGVTASSRLGELVAALLPHVVRSNLPSEAAG